MGHDFHTYVKLPEGILIDSISHVYRFVPYSVVKSAMFDGCTVVPYSIYIHSYVYPLAIKYGNHGNCKSPIYS